jgi:uncharacterized protein YecE (DUF72 family)
MSIKAHQIRIGTSGWFYQHWTERFYPKNLQKSEWFKYYCEHFDTVEVNNTFYHLPKQKTVENWQRLSPKNFLFAVKASRFITHIKRLQNIDEPLGRFFEIVKLLKSKLGPILFQLPPSMAKNIELLSEFIQKLPKNKDYVFEFRNQSWYSDDIYELLDKNNVGICVHDMPGNVSPKVVTGKIIYIRFHGLSGRYEGNYSKKMLKDWADWINENKEMVKDIFAYFNNDCNAYAVFNAKTLKQILRV